MRIRPKLFDWDNLKGPQWVQPELSHSELTELAEATVMFMGHDPASPHKATVLGSGFIVGVSDTLIVATASHIFTWWTDKLRPSAQHALRGLAGDREDMKRRLRSVIQDNTVAACVDPIGALSGLTLPIVGLAINSDPRELDVGFVQLAIPPGFNSEGFRTLPIDADPFSFDEPVVMAGYIGGGRVYSIGEEPFAAGVYRQNIAVRAGRVGELVMQPDGHRSAMYRVNMPSLPGMSGGPLMTLRPTNVDGMSFVTAVGVVSSSRLGSPILLNHCKEGETWVSPIALGLGRKVSINGTATSIADAIHGGTVAAYGHKAKEFQFVRDESNGVAFVSLRKRSEGTKES